MNKIFRYVGVDDRIDPKARKEYLEKNRGITLIALVITIVLNCSYLAMERMLKEVKILKKDETSCII